jgi:hypothetical protein
MKRALITVATVGILASAGWVVEANAQYGAPAPAYGPAPAYAPGPAYAPAPAYRSGPSRRYARRAYRRSARQTYGTPRQTYGTPPATYAGNTAFTPGAGPPPYAVSTGSYAANSAQPNEWYAAPGPNRRGNMCVTHVDSLRGYGFQAPCKK